MNYELLFKTIAGICHVKKVRLENNENILDYWVLGEEYTLEENGKEFDCRLVEIIPHPY